MQSIRQSTKALLQCVVPKALLQRCNVVLQSKLCVINFFLVYSSSEEVLHILGKILSCLQRGRTCLIVPRKRTMDEIIKSGNMVIWQNIFSDISEQNNGYSDTWISERDSEEGGSGPIFPFGGP